MPLKFIILLIIYSSTKRYGRDFGSPPSKRKVVTTEKKNMIKGERVRKACWLVKLTHLVQIRFETVTYLEISFSFVEDYCVYCFSKVLMYWEYFVFVHKDVHTKTFYKCKEKHPKKETCPKVPNYHLTSKVSMQYCCN